MTDPDKMPDTMPEREADPRDDRTGWERERPVATCVCGRVITLRGMCAWCLHGVVPT